MAHYQGTAGAADRAKVVAAVLAIHAAMAAALLVGLNVDIASRAAEQIAVFDIAAPEPPPPPPPPPRQTPDRPRNDEGAAGRKAIPTEIAAPRVRPLAPPKIAAAPVPGAGSASSAGAAASGTGTGAGGSGSGSGGGGSGGDFSRFVPARLVRNITRGDYRAIAGGRMPVGTAMVSLRVEPDGVPANCRVTRSSGDPGVDANLCPLVLERLRFDPARDDRGRPIPYQLQYVARWSL